MSQAEAKQKTAQRAAELIESGMTVGIGSGTTATIFIDHLAKRVRDGLSVRAICSSSASEAAARTFNIPITDFDTHREIDLTVDGADQIAPGLALIKGGGGQLLREKIVVSATKRFVVIADSSKLVPQLGGDVVPVEVIQMAKPLVDAKLRELGLQPKLRSNKDNSDPYVTDEGNWILDSWTEPIADLERLSRQIREIIGVVEHGLFVNMASLAVISDGESVWELDRVSATNLFERTPLPAPGK